MNTATSIISTESHNHIGFITLNNPEKHNTINPALINALLAAYHDFENNPSIKVIILHANGKHFCAGGDLQHMDSMKKATPEENLADAKRFAQFFYTIYACKKPTICCVHGKIMGGGIGLMAAHDIVIAEKNAEFCFTEVKIGLMPATITPLIARRIGMHHAKIHMMGAQLFSADTALTISLVDHLTENAPLDHANNIAKLLCDNNLNSMQKTKQWLQELYPITQTQLDQGAQYLADFRK